MTDKRKAIQFNCEMLGRVCVICEKSLSVSSVDFQISLNLFVIKNFKFQFNFFKDFN